MRLSLAIEFSVLPISSRFTVQGRLETFLHKTLSNATRCRKAYFSKFGDTLVTPRRALFSFIRFQQNAGSLQNRCCTPSFCYQVL